MGWQATVHKAYWVQPSQPAMNNQVHPIEFALAVILSTVESVLWIINELLGLHVTAPETAPAALTTAPINPQVILIQQMTKRQLQVHTGIKSSRYNKAQLQQLALNRL